MRSPTQVAALCAAFVIALSTISAASAAVFSRTSESRIIGAMNRVRVANGLRPLRLAAKLHAAARAHSADMIRRGYFGHGAFDRRLNAFGVRAPVVGENLAWGSGTYGTSASFIDLWMHSAPHRANLLRAGYRRIGIGTVSGTFQGTGGAVIAPADFAGR